MGLLSTATGGILTGINTRIDSITSVAKGVLCLPQIFSPSGLQYLTSNIGNMLSNYAASVISGLTNFVASTITNTIRNVTGVIGSQLNRINNFLKDINESISLIKTYLKSLDERAKNIMQFLLDKENCNFAAAELAKCLISDVLEDVPRAVTRSLSNGTSDFNNTVLNVTSRLLEPERTITRYLNQAQTLANRARIQQMF